MPDIEVIEALDDLLSSPGWELVKKRLSLMLETAQRTLERDTPFDATNKARGAVAILRIALDLPSTMRDELAG